MDINQGIWLHRGCESLPKYGYDTSPGRYERERTKTNRRVTKSLHTTTYSWDLHENTVLYLERSYATIDLGVFALNTWFHDGRVAEDNEGRGTNEPEEGAQWRSPEEEWNTDYEQTGVERLLGDGVFTELKRVRA